MSVDIYDTGVIKQVCCNMCKRKFNRQTEGRIATKLLSIPKASHSLQLEVTEFYKHNTCRKVCIWLGVWLIANGREFRHHVWHMISLLQVCKQGTSFKHTQWRKQLPATTLEFTTAYCSWTMHRPILQHYAAILEWHEEKDFPQMHTFE